LGCTRRVVSESALSKLDSIGNLAAVDRDLIDGFVHAACDAIGQGRWFTPKQFREPARQFCPIEPLISCALSRKQYPASQGFKP
jgi:hypothetical protein